LGVLKPGGSETAATWGAADGVLSVTGRPYGYLRTEKTYRDYKLTVEWRWDPAFTPKPNARGVTPLRNSGVLLHVQGPDTVWPECLEAQLQEQNAGDFYLMGGVTTAEWAALRERQVAAANAASDKAALEKALANRRLARKAPSSEKALGEWNRYEIICRGGTVTLRVNGVEQNHGAKVSRTSGHIALQSEGAPVQFRNIKLDPLPPKN
ncbi:MAG: DUF1080 domain-containing protein, partial [Opitutaceae bacterium]|nr:DUF1080 domain-containing protein [Opitutaceae bacterium]